MTHRLENSQPIINIEIANNTLYVLVYFISKCLAYSTVITTLHCITVNGVYIYIYIFTALYCTVRSTWGFQVCLSVSMSMEFLLPNQMLIAVIH